MAREYAECVSQMSGISKLAAKKSILDFSDFRSILSHTGCSLFSRLCICFAFFCYFIWFACCVDRLPAATLGIRIQYTRIQYKSIWIDRFVVIKCFLIIVNDHPHGLVVRAARTNEKPLKNNFYANVVAISVRWERVRRTKHRLDVWGESNRNKNWIFLLYIFLLIKKMKNIFSFLFMRSMAIIVDALKFMANKIGCIDSDVRYTYLALAQLIDKY